MFPRQTGPGFKKRIVATLLIKADNFPIQAGEVKVGHSLLGTDGHPRKVLAVKRTKERLVDIPARFSHHIQLSPDCILPVEHFDRLSTGYGGSLAEQYRQFLGDRFG